jgi:hypothetical protein
MKHKLNDGSYIWVFTSQVLKLACILFLFVGCTHTKEGELVQDSKGNIYMLKQAPSHEGYKLESIDTAQLKKIQDFKK